MNKCFITKLEGVVDNTSLLKLGELRIGFSNNDNPSNIQSIGIGVTNPISLEILGNGYFTDSTGSNNLGKKRTLNPPSDASYIVGTNILSIIGKYNLTRFVVSRTSNVTYFCIDDLKMSKELTTVSINSESVIGDIASLSNLKKLTTLLIRNSKVVGDIASLSNLIELTDMDIVNTSIFGNINILARLPKLKTIYLSNTNVIGNIDALRNNLELTEIVANNTGITGDLAKLPESCTYISISNKNGDSFTWSTRSASSKIVSIVNSPKITNIDKMLQDQAQCVTSTIDSSNRIISATGTRTSASDAAVQTLQSKGYTVSITPE